MKNVGKRLDIDLEVIVSGNSNLMKDQRRQRFFEQWSRIRAEGVLKFGLKGTSLFSLGVFVPLSALQFFDDGILNGKRLLVRFVMSVIFGVILSAISWWTNEGRYKNILIDNRIRARETQ